MLWLALFMSNLFQNSGYKEMKATKETFHSHLSVSSENLHCDHLSQMLIHTHKTGRRRRDKWRIKIICCLTNWYLITGFASLRRFDLWQIQASSVITTLEDTGLWAMKKRILKGFKQKYLSSQTFSQPKLLKSYLSFVRIQILYL